MDTNTQPVAEVPPAPEAPRPKPRATFASSEQRFTFELDGASVALVLRPATEQERIDFASKLEPGEDAERLIVQLVRRQTLVLDCCAALMLRVEGLVAGGVVVTLPEDAQGRRDFLLRFDLATLGDLFTFALSRCHGLDAVTSGN